MRQIPEVSPPTKNCPNPEKWSMFDEHGSEVEVLEFLKALVVLLKPRVILETGTYKGYGTQALAEGCRKNRYGKVFSCDQNWVLADEAEERLKEDGIVYEVVIFKETGRLLIEKCPCWDFAFIDSGNTEVRIDELEALLPRLSPSGVVVMHDTGETHDLRPDLEHIIRRENLQAIFFDTPRGLCLLRK